MSCSITHQGLNLHSGLVCLLTSGSIVVYLKNELIYMPWVSVARRTRVVRLTSALIIMNSECFRFFFLIIDFIVILAFIDNC